MAPYAMESFAMKFFMADWLYGLIALPFVVAGAWWGVNLGAKALHRFISKPLATRLSDDTIGRSRKGRVIMLGVVSALLLIALARPQYGVKPVEVKRRGIDIMIALDTSKSMAARDVKPDRITRAKNEVGKLLSALEGNRMGLIAFAGKSFVECPLTLDMSTLKMFLGSLNPGSIPVGGTNIAEAIDDAIKIFQGSKTTSKALIILTDGESLTGDAMAAAEAAADMNIKIFPIGIGSESGAPIPDIDAKGHEASYKKDKDGNTIMSRLDVATLRNIADATGGEVFTSQGGALDLSNLYETLSRMEKTDIMSQEYTEYEERYQIVALIALILLLGDYILFEPKARRKRGASAF